MPRISPRVLASGKFDLIHPGHIFYLEKSKKLAGDGELWVVITNEENIEGNLFTDEERKEMLENIEVVDNVVVGEREVDFLGILRKVQPDIITLGYDQDRDALKKYIVEYGKDVTIERIDSLDPERYRSSIYKEILRKENGFR